MDVELHVRERPARGQIFHSRSRRGFDALGVQTGKAELIGQGHGKTSAQRCRDKLVRIGADTFGEARPKRILRFRENAAFGRQFAFPSMKGAFPNS